MFNCLKDSKYAVAILPDEDPGSKRAVFAPFFNIPTATTKSLSKYKNLTDCNILPISIHRKINPATNKIEQYILRIYPELDISGTDFAKRC